MTGTIRGETFTALYKKSEDELREFNKEDLENLISPLGFSLLAVAVNRDEKSHLAKFLRLGLKIDVEGKQWTPESSPFIMAIILGRVECLKMLLEYHGSCANSKKYSGPVKYVPLDYLISDSENWRKDCETAELLLQHGAEVQHINTRLLRKLAKRTDLLRLLIDNGVNIQGIGVQVSLLSEILPSRDQYADEPLLSTIQLLAEKGTDMSDPWYLSWSCLNNQTSVTKLLLQYSPVRVLWHHDRYVTSAPSLLKCCNPLCALVYTTLEFGEDCRANLMHLMDCNVQFAWTNNESVPRAGYIAHASTFDMLPEYVPKTGPQIEAFFRTMLRYGVPWSRLSPLMSSETMQALEKQGFVRVLSLKELAKYVVLWCIGPVANRIELSALVETLELPRELHDTLLERDWYTNSESAL